MTTRERMAYAVLADHGECMVSSCDIRAALVAGCPFTAAFLLSGATETPHVDALVTECGLDLRHPEDWDRWETYHDEHARECPACGAFNYGRVSECGNCGGDLDTDDLEHDEQCRYLGFGLWDCGTADQH